MTYMRHQAKMTKSVHAFSVVDCEKPPYALKQIYIPEHIDLHALYSLGLCPWQPMIVYGFHCLKLWVPGYGNQVNHVSQLPRLCMDFRQLNTNTGCWTDVQHPVFAFSSWISVQTPHAGSDDIMTLVSVKSMQALEGGHDLLISKCKFWFLDVFASISGKSMLTLRVWHHWFNYNNNAACKVSVHL